jgi:hypothetical protein
MEACLATNKALQEFSLFSGATFLFGQTPCDLSYISSQEVDVTIPAGVPPLQAIGQDISVTCALTNPLPNAGSATFTIHVVGLDSTVSSVSPASFQADHTALRRPTLFCSNAMDKLKLADCIATRSP